MAQRITAARPGHQKSDPDTVSVRAKPVCVFFLLGDESEFEAGGLSSPGFAVIDDLYRISSNESESLTTARGAADLMSNQPGGSFITCFERCEPFT